MSRFAALALWVAFLPAASAGEFNKVLGVGDAAPAWSGLAGTDGKSHALADLKGKAVVVVVFTCNSCPVAADYEPRVIALARAFAGRSVAVVAINVNTGKEDALPAMAARAAKKKYPFPYLYDPTQKVARDYGAAYTPEVFVLDKARKVVYTGAFDDKPPPGTPTKRLTELAVEAALAGKPAAVGETSASPGCRIKFARKRSDD